MIDKIKEVLNLAEEWCVDQENGLTESQVCISALKDIRCIVQQDTFKFGLGDVVKVQVFSFVTKGDIIKRVLYETQLGVNFKYKIQFGESYEQTIYVWEQDLLLTQDLPLGEIL